MPQATLEDRVTVVEHKVAENEKGIAKVWDAIVELRASMDRRFEAMEQRFQGMEQRFDRRFEAMDLRFDAMEQRFDQRFRWLIGIVVMSLVAMLTIVGAALFRG